MTEARHLVCYLPAHRGRTFGEIAKIDPGYLLWLVNWEGAQEKQRQAARLVLEALDGPGRGR